MPRLWSALRPSIDRPSASLVTLFICWKLLLLTIAFLSPGRGYDSSTQLFFRAHENGRGPGAASVLDLDAVGPLLATKLVRWDAIYMTSAALKGYVHEQEWAFSWGFTSLVKLASSVRIVNHGLLNVVYHAIFISNLSHLLSALVLYRLTLLLGSSANQKQLAFLTGALHVLSPGGVFLTAPYSESTFALVNFLGQYFYSLSTLDRLLARKKSSSQIIYIVASGLCFGIATSIRSNGFLSGLVFAYDAFVWGCSILPQFVPTASIVAVLPAFKLDLTSTNTPPIVPTVVAGLLVAAGLTWPQYLAYTEFCARRESFDVAPWCSNFPPSIYSSIQSRYWNVGLFNYWTLSNIPLFLMAAPMLFVLVYSSYMQFYPINTATASKTPAAKSTSAEQAVLLRLALPQLALAILAFTGFHVQIINRISSGYPLWYMFLASSILENSPSSDWRYLAIRTFVVYALVQGVLYSAFLPPA